MATATSRLGLDEPTSSDTISGFPADDVEALGILDNAVIVTSGTLAARPAASAVPVGNEYQTTDTGQVFKSTGSAWMTLPTVSSTGAASVLQLLSSQKLLHQSGNTLVTWPGGSALSTLLTVTFPVAFPTVCTSLVFGSHITNDGLWAWVPTVSGTAGPTTFFVQGAAVGGSPAAGVTGTFWWMADGY